MNIKFEIGDTIMIANGYHIEEFRGARAKVDITEYELVGLKFDKPIIRMGISIEHWVFMTDEFKYLQPNLSFKQFGLQDSDPSNTCTCDIHLLMRSGCACGGFAREHQGSK